MATYPIEVLNAGEMAQLLGVCSRRAPCGIRNAALIIVLWRAGLRVSEGLALRTADLDLEDGSISVLHGKGDRRRIVGVDAQAVAVLERWIRLRKKLPRPSAGPLFCTITEGHTGFPLSGTYVRTMLHRLGAHAGIAKRVHPHGLRHTHADELIREGVPIHIIRQQLGHSSLATTDRYVDHLRPGEVLDTIRAREWPAPAGD